MFGYFQKTVCITSLLCILGCHHGGVDAVQDVIDLGPGVRNTITIISQVFDCLMTESVESLGIFVDLTVRFIVLGCIVKHQTEVSHGILHQLVLVIPDLAGDLLQINGSLDNIIVVWVLVF